MRNVLLCVIALLQLFFVCCRKESGDDGNNPGEKKYPVQLDVSGFTSEMEDFNGRMAGQGAVLRDSLDEYVHYLHYFVYKDNDFKTFVKQIDQRAGDTNFGLILDSLTAGRYIITLVASLDSLYVGPDAIGLNMLVYFNLPGTDAFYKRMILNVDGAVDQSVNLDRVVSKIKVVIRDNIPAAASQIAFQPRVFPEPPQGINPNLGSTINPATGLVSYGTTYSFTYEPYVVPVLDSIRGISNYAVEFYLLTLGSDKIALNIWSRGVAGDTLGVKLVNNIAVEPGKRTVLSGFLYDTATTGGVSVGINNPNWALDSISVAF
jgi:hypothetical protein